MNTQKPIIAPPNPDTPKLMPFNGYYTLGNATGAFFAVDTNMHVNPDSPDPVFELTLIISLDGTCATRYPFTGTFDGTTLIQNWEGLSIFLIFTRTVENSGPVATCAGSIALPGQTPVPVSGNTYNNPIPASLFAGDYYVSPKDTAPIKVMSIGSNNQLYYDNGSNNGNLSPVPTYKYNMNMYYFQFKQGSEQVNLIMGTAGNKGFACNNMTIGTSLVVRSLFTIPESPTPPIELYDLSGVTLAYFSGYYATPGEMFPLAFVSIQAQYATLIPGTDLDLNFVMISISQDGLTSTAYYFNPLTMSFDGETLSMPQQGITLTLKRAYNPQNGSLVTLSGSIYDQSLSGSNLFNPVPLSVFGGLPLTNSQGDTLTVNNDNSVTYNDTVMNGIIYVPLMYILAYPAQKPEVVMSFGTDGTKGTACIVTTDVDTSSPVTTSVWSNPSGK